MTLNHPKTTPAPLLGKEGTFAVEDRVYGQWEVEDPLAVKLIQLPAFQRLYHIGQYGSYWFGLPEANTNRAEHSLGVYYLLRHFKASREVQIAGLLHDISHTVFSHVIDYLQQDLGQQANQSTQDDSHAGIIAQDEIVALLKEAGLDYKRIGDIKSFSILDKELPDLCADRLDYFLRDSVCYKEITPEEARGILSHIVLVNNVMTIDDPDVARFMTRHSALMNIKHWGPPWGCFIFDRTAAALRRSLELGLITEDDFYSTDFVVWDKMKQSDDNIIKLAISDVENIKNIKLCLDESDYDYHLTSKFRMIDPPVLTESGVRRTSELFPELARTMAEERERYERGFYIKVVR